MRITPGAFKINQQGKDADNPDIWVEGWVTSNGLFGIQHGVQGFPPTRTDPFYLTHIVTGRAFGLDFMTLTDAKIAARRIAAVGVDWTSTDAKKIGKSNEMRQLYRAMHTTRKRRKSDYFKDIPLNDGYANPATEVN